MTSRASQKCVGLSESTKVMIFGCAILAVLFSFWGIVWFIRSYVEPPRVMLPGADLACLRRKHRNHTARTQAGFIAEPYRRVRHAEAPAAEGRVGASRPRRTCRRSTCRAPSTSLADRWAPVNQFATPAPTPAPGPPPAAEAGDRRHRLADHERAAPSRRSRRSRRAPYRRSRAPRPLPRRKPVMTAQVKRANTDPPLPRPRPDGQVAPQSVRTASLDRRRPLHRATSISFTPAPRLPRAAAAA